ncbi:MAG: BACON domain-containing protein [Candidatus Helarchaeota archaeon]
MFAKNKVKLSLVIIFAILSVTSISCKKTPTTPDINSLTLPVIWLNKFEVSFTASETAPNPSDQILKIKNSGPGTLNYTISDDASWLTISPSSGSSSGQIVEHTISVDKTSLTARNKEYSATITVTCPNA